ncbi:MAG: dihydropyrimidinase [bacterium]|nr:dihydropyrimidinase [bacterium]
MKTSTNDTILIKGGTVVLGQAVSVNDVLIKGEKINAVGDLSGLKADVVYDASGLLVLPGAIDPHIHFNENNKGHTGVHDYYTGSRAAAFGGTTSVVDFSDQIHGEPLINVVRVKEEQAEGKALIDWNVHPIISQVTAEVLKEVPSLIEAGAPTFKCFMTYRSMSGESAVNMYSGQEGRFITDEEFTSLSQCLEESGGMLMVHAEDSTIIDKNAVDMIAKGKTKAKHHAMCRPPESETNALKRIFKIANRTGGRIFIVHLSSGEGVEVLGDARGKGLNVYAETTPHYLIFTDDILDREDGYKWLGSPPIRDKKTQDKLWKGIADGRISMVATDDCAFSLGAKSAGADNFELCPEGMPGIEPRLTILYSEGVARDRISLPRLVELTSTNPARLFGMYPKKGSLDPGRDADIVLFDPSIKWTMSSETLHMGSDYCPYDGVEVTGKVAKVFSRGELIIDGEECIAEKGRGRYIHCKLDRFFPASV